MAESKSNDQLAEPADEIEAAAIARLNDLALADEAPPSFWARRAAASLAMSCGLLPIIGGTIVFALFMFTRSMLLLGAAWLSSAASFASASASSR